MTDLLAQGATIRAEVLGRERSEKFTAGMTDFDQPFQEMALRYCWGEIWSRPGIDRRTRSIVTLSMLVGMSRPEELRTHVRGALTNGVTRAEIQEIFLHATVYCGVPVAGEAFGVARAVFAEPAFSALG